MAPRKNRTSPRRPRRNGKAKAVKPVVLANNQDLRPLRRRKQPRAPRRARPQHVAGVCSITDPFCPAAKNAKWPDGTSGNTLTEQFRGNFVLASDASGNNMTIFSPHLPFGYIGTTAGTTSTGFASYKQNSMLATYGDKYRIVSFGIITRVIASATTASGIITFGTAGTPLVSTAYTAGTELYQEVAVKAIQPGMEFSWISAPNGTGARDFVAQSTSTVLVPTDFQTLYIEIAGAPANSNMAVVEWFINVEFTPLTTARALTAIAKPNPPKSNLAEQAVSHVHSHLGSFIEGGVVHAEQAVAKFATEALTSFFDDPLSSLAGLFA